MEGFVSHAGFWNSEMFFFHMQCLLVVQFYGFGRIFLNYVEKFSVRLKE